MLCQMLTKNIIIYMYAYLCVYSYKSHRYKERFFLYIDGKSMCIYN